MNLWQVICGKSRLTDDPRAPSGGWLSDLLVRTHTNTNKSEDAGSLLVTDHNKHTHTQWHTHCLIQEHKHMSFLLPVLTCAIWLVTAYCRTKQKWKPWRTADVRTHPPSHYSTPSLRFLSVSFIDRDTHSHMHAHTRTLFLRLLHIGVQPEGDLGRRCTC